MRDAGDAKLPHRVGRSEDIDAGSVVANMAAGHQGGARAQRDDPARHSNGFGYGTGSVGSKQRPRFGGVRSDDRRKREQLATNDVQRAIFQLRAPRGRVP